MAVDNVLDSLERVSQARRNSGVPGFAFFAPRDRA
jgi:hypothetical protein